MHNTVFSTTFLAACVQHTAQARHHGQARSLPYLHESEVEERDVAVERLEQEALNHEVVLVVLPSRSGGGEDETGGGGGSRSGRNAHATLRTVHFIPCAYLDAGVNDVLPRSVLVSALIRRGKQSRGELVGFGWVAFSVNFFQFRHRLCREPTRATRVLDIHGTSRIIGTRTPKKCSWMFASLRH